MFIFMRRFVFLWDTIFCTCVKMEEYHGFQTYLKTIAQKFHEECTFYSAIMQEKLQVTN